MQCVYCGSVNIHKRGKTTRGKKKYQRYFCEGCQKSFSELSGTIYENHNLTPTHIDLALKYKDRGMNFSQIAKILRVSSKSVSNLIKNNWPKNSSKPTNPIDLIDSQPDINDGD